jgi:hypothetical protein
MIKKLIKIKAYNDYNVWIIIGDVKKGNNFVSKLMFGEGIIDDDDAGCFIHNGTNGGIMWLRDVPNNPRDIAIFCHESIHAGEEILKRLNIHNEEALCHLCQSIIEDVLIWVAKNKDKKSKRNKINKSKNKIVEDCG